MDGIRYGNSYRIHIFNENSYGKLSGNYVDDYRVLCNSISIKPETETIEVNVKTNKIEQKHSEKLAGRKNVIVTIKGDLSPDHTILLEAYSGKTTFPYEHQNSNVPRSYEIHQFFLKDSKANIIKGCVLETLKLSGDNGKTIEFEAVFRGQLFESEIDCTKDRFTEFVLLDHTPAVPFVWGNSVSISLLEMAEFNTFNKFSMNISNTFINDELLYQNSFLKQCELISCSSGEFEFSSNYLINEKGWMEQEILKDTPFYNTFTLSNGSDSWKLEFYSKITEINPSDPEKQIFQFSAKTSLCATETNPMLKISNV